MRARFLSIPVLLVAMLAGAWASAPALAQQTDQIAGEALASGAGLVVSGVAVDTRGETDREARLAGWREAQRLAWPRLWSRLSGRPESEAPRLSDAVLDQIVSAIEVERAALGGGRYIAQLAVIFDRSRAAAHLGQQARFVLSPPFLLLPLLEDGGTRFGVSDDSPWVAAWARLRPGETQVDYIRVTPQPAERLILSAWLPERRQRQAWRQVVERYEVDDVLIPELVVERSWFGGPVTATLIARMGPEGREVGRTTLAEPSGEVDRLFDRAVRAADQLYTHAMQDGRLIPDPELQPPPAPPPPIGNADLFEAAEEPLAAPPPITVRLRIATPDAASVTAAERALAALDGVAQARAASLLIGGVSEFELATGLARPAIVAALEARGWTMGPDGALRAPPAR